MTRRKNPAEKKTFVLVDKNNKPKGSVFTHKQPRGAALKAANKGHRSIRLKERGTDKVHVFKGSSKVVTTPDNAPEWLPAKTKKAFVSKLRIDYID